MDKYTPIIIMLFNLLLSALASYVKLPVQPIAGMEGQLILIALIAAGVGTICGLGTLQRGRFSVMLILLTALMIFALAKYNGLLVLGGATRGELLWARFLYGYIFFAIFFVFTHLEKALKKLFSPRPSAPTT